METQAAEIASGSESAKVDSEATTGSTEGSAPSTAETGAANDQASPEKKRDEGQERFDKLTRDLYELRGELDRGRFEREQRDKEIAELRAQLSETAKQRQVAPDNPPTLEQFGFDEAKYQAALISHLTQQIRGTILDEVKGELGKGEQQRTQREIQSNWTKREQDFIKSQPDYVDKVANARTLPISKEMQTQIQQLEDGPQIAYHLVENREKALLIMQLPFEHQLMELGRIRGEIAAKKAVSKPPVSQAPPPPSKIGAEEAGTHVRVDSADSDNLSDAEWTRRRNAQELARRRKANS